MRVLSEWYPGDRVNRVARLAIDATDFVGDGLTAADLRERLDRTESKRVATRSGGSTVTRGAGDVCRCEPRGERKEAAETFFRTLRSVETRATCDTLLAFTGCGEAERTVSSRLPPLSDRGGILSVEGRVGGSGSCGETERDLDASLIRSNLSSSSDMRRSAVRRDEVAVAAGRGGGTARLGHSSDSSLEETLIGRVTLGRAVHAVS